MADGREIEVWEHYASQCVNRSLITIDKNNWFAQKLTELPNIQTIVDIGCGPGNWANLFLKYTYIAFDQSPSMLDLVMLNCPTAKTKLGNAMELQKYFENGSIDLCFTSAVLQHNRHVPDKENIVKGIYSILKPNGYYMCAENTLSNYQQTDGYSFTLKGWEDFMINNGFKLIEYIEISYESAVPTSLYLYQKV